MTKRNTKIETPGQPASDPSAEAPADAAVPAENPPPKADAMTPEQEAQLAKDLARTAPLVGANEAIDWSTLNNGLQPSQAKVDPNAGLPESADPDTIAKPVLTKSGWVLPTNDARARFGQK